VWEAEQVSLGRPIAIKRLHAAGKGAPATMEGGTADDHSREVQFRQEATLTARLDHPNIVTVHELAIDETGRSMLAMKLVRGTPWDVLLRADARKPLPERLDKHLPILLAVAQAVAFAHARGIIHRDLKPAQVMVGQYGEVQLMDWGLAMRAEVPHDSVQGEPGNLIPAPGRNDATNPAGTPAYMAPEQTQKTCDALGPWTDVFLLGGMLYAVLTGTPPWNRESARESFTLAAREEVQPPEERRPGQHIPRELSAICVGAMRREPADRTASVVEFISQLEGFRTGAGKRAESLALLEEARRQFVDHRGSYRVLDDCQFLLSRALGLWPENLEAEEMGQLVLREYAISALSRSDLNLVRAHLDRLTSEAKRAEIMAEVERREDRLRHHRIQRRRGMMVIALLGVAVSALAILAVREGRRARQAEAEARQSLDKAEVFVDRLMDTLREELDPIGRSDILGAAAEAARDYVGQSPTDGIESPDRLLVRARLIGKVADAMVTGGETAKSLDAYEEAIGMATSALEATKRSREASRGLRLDIEHLEARLNTRYGRTLAEANRPGEGLEALRHAADRLATLAKAHPKDLTIRGNLLQAQEELGAVLLGEGEVTEAEGLWQQALLTADMLKKAEPNAAVWRRRTLRLLARKASGLQSLGRTAEAEQAWNDVLAEYEGILEDGLEEPALGEVMSKANANISALQWSRGELALAIVYQQGAVGFMQQNLSIDSTRDDRREELARGYLTLAELYVAGADSDASRALESGTRHAARLLAKAPDNRRYLELDGRLALAWGEWEAKSGNADAAAKQFELARERFARLAELESTQGEWTEMLAHIDTALRPKN